MAEGIGKKLRADDSADRSGTDSEYRLLGSLACRGHAARRLHDQQRVLIAQVLGTFLHTLEVTRGAGTDEAVDCGRDRAFVLARLGDQLMRADDENGERQFPYQAFDR